MYKTQCLGWTSLLFKQLRIGDNLLLDLIKYIFKRLGFWENPIFYENDVCHCCGKSHETLELLNHNLNWAIKNRVPFKYVDFMNYRNFKKLMDGISKDTYIKSIIMKGNDCTLIVQYYPHFNDSDPHVDRQEAFISNCITHVTDCRIMLMQTCMEFFNAEHIPEYVKIGLAVSIEKYFSI